MLVNYFNKLLRPSPPAPPAVCPVCLERGRIETVEVNGRAYQRVAGCRCDKADPKVQPK